MKKEASVFNLKKSTLFVFKSKKKKQFLNPSDPTNTSSTITGTGTVYSVNDR